MEEEMRRQQKSDAPPMTKESILKTLFIEEYTEFIKS
jgi:hypothetical protein